MEHHILARLETCAERSPPGCVGAPSRGRAGEFQKERNNETSIADFRGSPRARRGFDRCHVTGRAGRSAGRPWRRRRDQRIPGRRRRRAASAPGGRNGQITESPTPGKATQDRTIPEKKSTEQVPANGKQAPVQQGQAAPAADERHEGGAQQGASERNEGSRQGANERHDGNTRQGANEHGMKSSNVSLTTEQKTTIRKTVLTSSAPRVTKVDFDVKIGVVVPRTVRVAPIPTTLITIEPEWRGYTYFVYADEIIIVNPRTLEIVAVLDV